MAPRPLHLPIANPCHENWGGMHPVEGGRFCDSCEKQVHDLTGLTETEARDVLRPFAGQRVCVRYRQGSDGALTFKPTRALAQAAGIAAALSAAACTPHRGDEDPAQRSGLIDKIEVQERVTMGEAPAIEVPPATPQVQEPCSKTPPTPAVEPPEVMIQGEIAAPEMPTPTEPTIDTMGNAPVPERLETPCASGGTKPAVAPPEVMVKGDVAVPEFEPTPAPTPKPANPGPDPDEVELLGDVEVVL